jgi:Helicase HerA, central domain
MHEPEEHPLVKVVPGHLFHFEEKIFGMSLTQLLSDIGAGVGILSITASLPLGARIFVSIVLAIPVLILVHGKVQEQTLLHWLSLYGRQHFVPKHTTWQSLDELTAAGKRKRGRVPDVQATWIALDSLEGGIAGYSEPGCTGGTRGRYWVVLECEGRTIRYLPETEQVRAFGRFESFLTGLEFQLQFISHTEQVQVAQYKPLLVQKQALSGLAQMPRLALLQKESIAYQERHLHHCTITRHFVVISTSAREEAARQTVGTSPGGVLSFLWKRLTRPKRVEVSREQVLDLLRIRISVVKKMLQQLEVRAWLLDDAALLKQFASCLALGAEIPLFEPACIDEPSDAVLALAGHADASFSRPHELAEQSQAAPSTTVQKGQIAAKAGQRTYRKRLQGLHGTFVYTSRHEQARFEAGVVRLADLVAPSRIVVLPDALEVEVRDKIRYQRYFHVTGYGHQLLCGWVGDLSEIGLPMVIASSFTPIDSDLMIKKLELQLVKLESKRLADQKTLRISKASQNIEAEQVRRVVHALASRRLKVFMVQMTIGISAGSRDRLEQRTHYLLSHLRQKQFNVRIATRRQETAWQATLPTCPPQRELDLLVNLPSDVLCTFLHCSSGVIGTPTGVFLGFTGSGAGRRPVFFNPWSEDKKIPNPHVVIVGETGMGKSFTGKLFVTGIMGMSIADVVVLDRDDDYLPLHEFLGSESQRVVLARGCPINFFDLPYGPQDVDPDDPSDLLSEYIDNQLLVGLTLLICDADTRLSKIEEAYLMHVARNAYAAKGIESSAIRHDPKALLRPMPTLVDFIETLKATPASSESMQASLIERLEKASYLFSGQTSISLEKPLTVFSIYELDEKWYPLMTFTVQNFLMRHRALRQDERYLAYVVEEASYMLKHPAGRTYLERGSRGFRKLGIAQFTLSQHPREFLQEGAVILNNAGTAFYLGMQRNAAQELGLSQELERTLTAAVPGQVVMRCGNEYAAVTIATSPRHHAIFTTDPSERRRLRERARGRGIEAHALV